MSNETLYHSKNLEVRQTTSQKATSKADIVTFESIGVEHQTVVRRPFGHALADKFGINILHVIPRGADWYHYPDMDDCLASVAQHTTPDTLVYGSSMGGYAAVRFADALGATRSLAVSPQASIQRRCVPFESRWRDHAARISFLHPDALVQRNHTAWIMVDPEHEEDKAHVDLLQKSGPVKALEVPFGGHPVGRALVEAGLLSGILQDFMSGHEDDVAINTRIKSKIHTSATALINMSRRSNPVQQKRLLEKAYKLSPENPKVAFYLGMLRLRAKDYDAAEELLAFTFSQHRTNQQFVNSYQQLCRRLGIPPNALKRGA